MCVRIQGDGDALTLHNEKVWVVDVELDGMKQVLNLSGGGAASVNVVFALASNEDLSCDGHLGALFIADGAVALVLVVEHNRDAGLVDPRLALLVHQFRQIAGTDLTQIGNAQNKTDCIENIRFSRAVQTGNGVEMRIESGCMVVSVDDEQTKQKRQQLTHRLLSDEHTI